MATIPATGVQPTSIRFFPAPTSATANTASPTSQTVIPPAAQVGPGVFGRLFNSEQVAQPEASTVYVEHFRAESSTVAIAAIIVFVAGCIRIVPFLVRDIRTFRVEIKPDPDSYGPSAS